MSASKIIIAVSLSALATAAAAHQETYQGVHPLTHGSSRAAVLGQLTQTVRAGNAYSEGASSGVLRTTSVTQRSATVAQAVAAAHDPRAALSPQAYLP